MKRWGEKESSGARSPFCGVISAREGGINVIPSPTWPLRHQQVIRTNPLCLLAAAAADSESLTHRHGRQAGGSAPHIQTSPSPAPPTLQILLPLQAEGSYVRNVKNRHGLSAGSECHENQQTRTLDLTLPAESMRLYVGS